MKRKIYNKKGFWGGVTSLLLVVVSIIVTIPNEYHKGNSMRLTKSIIFNVLLLTIGITSIYRSLNYQYTKEDIQNDDEREKLISLKASNSALKITTIFCFIITILLMVTFAITRHEEIIGALVVAALIFNVLLISPVIAYFYYNKNN